MCDSTYVLSSWGWVQFWKKSLLTLTVHLAQETGQISDCSFYLPDSMSRDAIVLLAAMLERWPQIRRINDKDYV